MTLSRTLAGGFCALAVGSLALAPAARAADQAIRIDHPWSRPTPPSAPTAVGYLTIVNTGARPDRLVAASSPAAASVTVHSMSMAGGIMRMRPVEGGVPVPPGGSVVLGPDGLHLMFEGLKQPFHPGEHIPVVLTFDHAGRVHTALAVETSDGSKPAMEDMHGMNMPGMDMH